MSGFGFASAGTNCTLSISVVASTSGVKTFARVGGAQSAFGYTFNPGADLGLPGDITISAPPVPSVTSLSSSHGSNAGGQTLYINGTNLSGTTGVTIGGTAATGIVVDSATQIHVTTPAHAVGLTDVLVTTGGGTSANTAADNFTYLAPPTLAIVISPSTRLTGLNATMTITVTNPNSTALTGFSMTGVPTSPDFGLGGAPTASGCYSTLTFGGSGLNTSGGTVPANGSCTIVAPVAAFAAGSYTLSISATSASPGSLVGLGATSNTLTVTPPAPAVTAVTAHARVAGGNSIVISGSNLTGATAVTFGGVNATSFTVNSSNQITAVAPAHALGVVDVLVTTAGGTSPNTAADNMTYVAPPIASLVFSPTSVVTLQNSTLTITLTNPNPTVALTGVAMNPSTVQDYLGLNSFPTTTCGASFIYSDTAGLTANGGSIPAGGSCTFTLVMRGFQPNTYTFSVGTIAVINQGNPSGPGATSNVLTVNPAAPTVTGVSPTSGPTAGGTSVVITGTEFSSVSAVTFGVVPAAAYTVNSTTQITATTPSSAAGAVNVQVTNTTGTSATGAAALYTYVGTPTITGNPSNASVNAGSTTTFTASASGSPSVQWQVSTNASGASYVNVVNTGGVYADATSNTLTVTGQMSRHGLHYRAVFTNAGGTVTSADAVLSVNPAPPVVSVSLSATTIVAGNTTTLTLSISNPNDIAMGAVFGQAGNANLNPYVLPTGVTVSSTGAINCSGGNLFSGGQGQIGWSQVPANSSTTCSTTVALTSASAGTYSFADIGYTLSQNGGQASGVGAIPSLTVVATPTVSSISRQAGPVAGGSNVSITGSNFTPSSTVSFGGAAATSVSFINSITLSAVSPAGTGTVDVRVTNLAGTSANTAADNFTYLETPVITQIDPMVGPEAGNWNVYLVGQNFTPDTAVTFGGVPANSVTFDSATFLTANAPAGTGVVDVIATNAGGSSANTAADNFTYVPRPNAPTFTTPVNGSISNSFAIPSGTADPNTFVNLYLDGNPLPGVNANGSGNWTYPGALMVSEGNHTLTARVTTDGGTSPDGAVTFRFDSTTPNVPVINTPADGSATTNRSPTYSGTAEPNAVIEVTVSANFIGTVNANGSGAWSITQPSTLAVGSHVVQARATDAAGNVSAYSSGNTFTVFVQPNLSIDDLTVNEGNLLAFTISLDGPAGPGGVTFDIAVNNGTAIAGIDFVDPALTGVTIPQGQNRYDLLITTIQDLVYEPNKTFSVQVVNLTGAVAADNTGAGQINNEDASPMFSVNDVSLSEGDSGTTNFTFEVTKTGPTELPASIDFRTENITAISSLNDFSAVQTILTFAAGETTRNITVVVNGDTMNELDETFRVTLRSPIDARLGDSMGIGTIVNDDALPSLSVNDVTLNEGASGTTAFTFTASLSAASGQNVSVSYETVGLTAAAGSDFTGISGILNFAPGVTTQTATVLVNGNDVLEPNETFAFNLSAPTNASLADSQGLGTILNDDVAPPSAPVTLAPANGSTTGDSTPTYTGTAEPSSTVDVIVDGTSVGTTTADGSGNWSYTGSTPLADGPHTVRSAATNSGGTSPSSNTNTFTVDTTAPASPVVLTPANGSISTSLTPTYSGTAEPGSTVTVTVDGATVGNAIADGMGNWAYAQTSPLALGPHAVRASATDASGNNSSASATNSFTVLPPAPVAGPVSTTVAYGSTNNLVTLDLTGGAAATVAISTQATHGVATASGLTITYTPTAGYTGPDSFTYTATNAGGTSSPATATVTVGVPTLALNPTSVGPATVGAAFSHTLTASGGAAPYSYAVTAGALPEGVTLSSGGVLSGTPTAGGSFGFTVTATDSSTGTGAPLSVGRSYTLTVNAPTISVSPMSDPATVGSSFSRTLSAVGGTGPYSFAVTAGALPAGMSLASNGLLSGTPTAGGTFNFTVTATDSSTGTGPYTGSRAYSLVVSGAAITLPTASLPAGTVSAAYTGQIPAASGGTGPYSYVVSAGALPAGMTMSSTGALSGTPTAGGTSNFSVTATDSSTGSGPFSTTQSYSVTIAAPTIAVGPTALPDGVKAVAYAPQSITASSGVAPYSYALTAGALPNGLTLSASTGVLSGTPTENGTFSFTVTATDSATGSGPYTGSRAYTLVIALDPPVANPVSMSVAYNSATNPVTLNHTGGAANSIAIASAPTHGVATVSGLSISYTPDNGYFGPDSFTYTATNGSGTSAPATVSVTVGLPPAPTASATSVSVPYASTGTAIDLSGRVAGVLTGVSVGTGPSHGSVSVTGYVITYTPGATYFGADSFTYVAVGPGGNSAPATISLTVATPPPPTVTPTPPTPVPPTTGGSSTVNLQTQANGVVTGWRITVVPTNGSAVLEGAGPASASAIPGEGPQASGPAVTLRYTPAPGFMGTDTVTLVAMGPGGDSAPVTFTFQVPGMAPNRSATLASNAVSTINATSGLTGGPFNSVQITRAPGFGTAAVSGLNIVFTPGAPNAGPTWLEYTITTSGGTSAIGRIDYQVNRAPGAQTLAVSTPAGRPVTVSLTANAVGSPFSGAAITSLSVPTAGAAVLTESGVAGNRTYTVTFSPAGTFTGRVDIGFTLTNAFATEVGVVQVTVTPRADPSLDPEVRGMVSSQVDSTRRFARAQTDNFTRRLEQLRDGDNDSSSNLSLNLNMGGPSEIDPRAAARRSLGDQQASADGLSLMETRDRAEEAEAFAQFQGQNGQASTETTNAAPTTLGAMSASQTQDGGSSAGSVGVWAGGAVDWGRRDAENQRDTRFTTSGISAGVDVKVSDRLIVGAGLGYGEDRARVGSNETRSDGTNYVGAFYAAAKGPADLNFEAVLGYGSLDYASRRWSAAASAFAFGEREGDMVFGSVGLAQDQKWAGVSSSIYGRIEGQSVTLDAFTETGAGIHSLNYDELSFDAFSSTVGVQMSWQVETRDMVFTPAMRLEWGHEFSDTGVQTVSYSDWIASPRYGVNLDDWARDRFQLGLEGRWTFDAMELSAGYRASASSNSSSHGVEFKLTTRF